MVNPKTDFSDRAPVKFSDRAMKATALFVCLFTACTAQFCVDLGYGCLRLRATASGLGQIIACIPDGKYVEDLGSSRWLDGLMWRNIR